MPHLSGDKRIKEINSILHYLEKSSANLLKKYCIETNSGLNFSFSLGITGPNLSLGGKISSLFPYFKNRPFSRIFRNISQDMLNVERLGHLHDKLCSSVRKHADAMHPKIPTTPLSMEHKENERGKPAKIDI
jgi:hypothetical protein